MSYNYLQKIASNDYQAPKWALFSYPISYRKLMEK